MSSRAATFSRPATLAISLAVILLDGCASARRSGRTAPGAPAASSSSAVLAHVDRVRLAEAFRLADVIGDSVWSGWREAPFAVLLVTPEHEFLLRHPRPSADFARVGYDSLLGSEVLVRKRTFSPALLATFPAVGGVPTVVIGQAESTRKSSTEWVLTVLHEHFHQLQYSRPDYYTGVAALNLARGDETGMWMLNFPFPYDSAVVQERFNALASALLEALETSSAGRGGGTRYPADFLDARERLRASLSADDYRYLSFQLWQEGVARYTEYRLARLAAERYAPSDAFRALPDFTSFADAAEALRGEILAGLSDPRLGTARRVALYPVGAAMALLLDVVAPGWKRRYFERMFSLDAY
jgi:hypothetical protein